MRRRFLSAPTWVKVLIPFLAGAIIVGGLGILGARIGQNTVSIDTINQQRTEQAIASCRTEQYVNQALDDIVTFVRSVSRPGSPVAEQLAATVATAEARAHQCDLAAQRVGHPIAPPSTKEHQ